MLNSLRLQPWINLFVFLTNWAVWAVNITAVLGYIIAANPALTVRRAPNMHACHHIFYTISLFLSPVVVLVYWLLIFKKHKGEIWASTEVVGGRHLSMAERENLYD